VTALEKEELEQELIKWKMRTSMAMGTLRKMSRMMPENTEFGDMVRNVIKNIEDLT